MRYTTLIDISENRGLYKNKSVRLVYLHLCLKSGYRDNDRDKLRMSIRQLAYEVGVSVSATRHALRILTAADLVHFGEGNTMDILKFVQPDIITPRATVKRATANQLSRDEEARELEIQKYKERMEVLHRWYYEFINRGDTAAAESALKEYNQLKRNIDKLMKQ